ncbi:unnamed protein product, partial [marine sediment metagenome]
MSYIKKKTTWKGEQIYYVGKHGNDAKDGRSYLNAFLTFTQAIDAINLQSPAIDNYFTIRCAV